MIPDCLVLKIVEEEVDRDDDETGVDTTLYVLYDAKEEKYIIRGKRDSSDGVDFETYSFDVKRVTNLVYFISWVISTNNLFVYSLYNHKELPATSEEIFYEDLAEALDDEKEVFAYKGKTYNETELTDILKMLRNIKNEY